MHPETPSDPPARQLPWRGGVLSYTDEGQGPHTLVAIHGLPGRKRDFRWLAPALPPARLLRVDLPGFGGSSRPGHAPMTVAERAEAVMALIEALELPPVTLVSHSAGGFVTAHIARHHPHLVAACALLASPGPTSHLRLPIWRAVAQVTRLELGRRALRPVLKQSARMAGFPPSLSDDERLGIVLDVSVLDFEVHRENLAQMACPTLVAWADDDRIIPPAIFDQLAAMVPDGPRCRFETGGHNLQKSRAVELGEAFADLLQQSSGAC